MPEPNQSQTLSQKGLKPLLHLTSSLVGECDRQDLSWIDTMLANQVSNPMSQCTCFAATSTCHHKQGSLVMTDSPLLGIVKSIQKAHLVILKEIKQIASWRNNLAQKAAISFSILGEITPKKPSTSNKPRGCYNKQANRVRNIFYSQTLSRLLTQQESTMHDSRKKHNTFKQHKSSLRKKHSSDIVNYYMAYRPSPA